MNIASKAFAALLAAMLAAGMLMTAIIPTATGSISYSALTDLEAQVAQYLHAQGFTNEAIAGVMGNISHESTWDTHATSSDGNSSIGLFQFTGSNKTGFIQWCNSEGKDPYSAQAQLEWLFADGSAGHYSNHWGTKLADNHYYSNCGGYTDGAYYQAAEFKDATDVSKAAYSWMACYERCANGSTAGLQDRLDKAQEYFQKLRSGTIVTSNNEIVQRAAAELGKPYVWGAAGPNSYDCSGLVSYAITGRYEHTWSTTPIQKWEKTNDPQPGDICINSHHTGVYIGNGQMIHAPQTGDVVKISNVHSDMWYVKAPKQG